MDQSEVEQGLEELCGNVRAFAKRRKLPEPDLSNLPDNAQVVYVLPVFFTCDSPLNEASRRVIADSVEKSFFGLAWADQLEVGELTVAWEKETKGLPKKQPVG